MYYIGHKGEKKESIHPFHIKYRGIFGLLTSSLVFCLWVYAAQYRILSRIYHKLMKFTNHE